MCVYLCVCICMCMCVFVTRVQSIGTFSQGGFIIDRHTMWELLWAIPGFCCSGPHQLTM